MYFMHAQKGEATRTQFRACKISEFSGGVPPDPPQAISAMASAFCICPGPFQSSRQPCWCPLFVNAHNFSEILRIWELCIMLYPHLHYTVCTSSDQR